MRCRGPNTQRRGVCRPLQMYPVHISRLSLAQLNTPKALKTMHCAEPDQPSIFHSLHACAGRHTVRQPPGHGGWAEDARDPGPPRHLRVPREDHRPAHHWPSERGQGGRSRGLRRSHQRYASPFSRDCVMVLQIGRLSWCGRPGHAAWLVCICSHCSVHCNPIFSLVAPCWCAAQVSRANAGHLEASACDTTPNSAYIALLYFTMAQASALAHETSA